MPVAHDDGIAQERAIRADRRVGGRDVVGRLLIGGQVVDLVRHLSVYDLAIGRLQEAELIDARVHRHRADQANVRAFWGLDGADAPVVAVVDIAHLQLGALPRKTARAEGAQPALVRELCQRVRLVHELGKLAAPEEALDGGRDRLHRDDRLGRDGVRLQGGHAFLGHLLHAEEAQAELALQKLADGADALVLQVVDIIDGAFIVAQLDDIADDGDQVVLGQASNGERQVDAQLLVHLMAADPGKVIALDVKEDAAEERARALAGRRIAGAYLPIDVKQRLILGALRVFLLRDGVLLDGRLNVARDLNDLDVLDASRLDLLHQGALQLVERLGEDLSGVGVGHVLVDAEHGAGVEGDQALDGGVFDHPNGAKEPIELVGGRCLRALGRTDFMVEGVQRAQQCGDRELARLPDAHEDHIVGIGVHLDPRPLRGDHLGREEHAPGIVNVVAEINAGRAGQLADDDALGAVDNKGALLRHHR